MPSDESVLVFFFLVALFTTYAAPILFVQWPQGKMGREKILFVRILLLWVLTLAGWSFLFLTSTELAAASGWVNMHAAYFFSILTTLIAGFVLVYRTKSEQLP